MDLPRGVILEPMWGVAEYSPAGDAVNARFHATLEGALDDRKPDESVVFGPSRVEFTKEGSMILEGLPGYKSSITEPPSKRLD